MPAWIAALLERFAGLLERALNVWLAVRWGQAKQKEIDAKRIAEAKDEQAKIALDAPRTRDDLVERLRKHGL